MTKARALASALLAASLSASPATPAAPAGGPPARVEARSSDLVAVGVVRADRMTIHLSRVIDNAPVNDAVVGVRLRGATHPTIADADGSYSFQSPDLTLPGPASIEFMVTAGPRREELEGTLDVAGPAGQSEDRGSSRQLGWWVLNFAVCIGFLWLWSRRKSRDA